MKKFFTHLIQLLLVVTVLIHTESVFAQCPTFPTDTNNWGDFTRIHYNGNWLLNANGTGYATSPPPTRTTVSVVHPGFGVDDYATDTNFSTIAPPTGLINPSPIIRVGQKFGGGAQTPTEIRRAEVLTFTFTPTTANSKIRVYYIGMVQDNSSAAILQNANRNFRRTGFHTIPSFGVVCNYQGYNSNAPNSNTNTKSGRTEFGSVNLNGSTPGFTTPTPLYQEYGLNDMFSFVKGGANVNPPIPVAVAGIRKMGSWEYYDMDFSEFIGTTDSVTITLYANTANTASGPQGHSYSYFQFDCSGAPTPIPNIDVMEIPDFYLGCKKLPQDIEININTIPTLLGLQPNIKTNAHNANNGHPHRWLHLEGTTAPNEQYLNKFASLKLDLVDQSGNNINPLPYSNVKHANGNTIHEDILLRIDGPPSYIEPATSSTPEVSVYRFRATYKVKDSNSQQIDFFEVRITVQDALACTVPSTGNIGINPATALDQFSPTTYLICKQNDNTIGLPNFTITLGAAACTFPSDNPTSFLRYQWERKNSSGAWSPIVGATSVNLPNAQGFVYHNSCNTSFRRATITNIPCSTGVDGDGNPIYDNSSETVTNTVYSPEILTIWNEAFVPYDTNTNIVYTEWVNAPTPGGYNDAFNIPLCNATMGICFGDTATFSGDLSIGSNLNTGTFNTTCNLAGCNGPDLPVNGSNHVSAQFILNFGQANATVLHTIDQNYNGYSATIPYNFNYIALPDNYFTYAGSGTQPQNSGGFTMYGSEGTENINITLVLTTTYNGCTSVTHTPNFMGIIIYPRGIGGEIIDPSCPHAVNNDATVYTTGFDNNGGVPTGYTWEYSSSQAGPWTTIGGQGDVNLQLWTMAVLGVNRTYYIRRVAKPGLNCGGTEPSNVIEIETPVNLVVPTFNALPTNQTICKQAGFQQLPTTSNNGILGTWHTYSTSTSGGVVTPIIGAAISPSQYSTNTAGTFRFIFIPSTTNTVCADFYIHNVTILAPITPTSAVLQSYCETTLPFNLPTTSSTGNPARPIIWEVLNENTGNYEPVPNNQWNPNLYTAALDNSTHANGVEVLTFRFSLDPNPLATNYYQCGVPVTRNIRLNRTINFTTPTTLSYCVGQTTGIMPLPTQSNIINGQWKRGTTVVTSISTATAGTFTYAYTGTNTCAPHPPIVVTISPIVTPTFNQVGPICRGTVFTLPTTSNTNGITGTWSPAINNLATTTYTFHPTAGQCVPTINTTMTVVVNPIVTPNFNSSLFRPICQGATMNPLPTQSNGINGVTGSWSPALNNQTTTTYTFTPAAGQCANTITRTIIVKPWQTPVFENLATSFCIGSPLFTLPTVSSNNISGTWEPTTINNTTVGSHDYTFTPTVIPQNNQCANPITITIETTECVPILTWDGEVGCEASGDPKDISDFIADGPCIKVCENSSITYTIFGNNATIASTQWIVTNGTITSQNNTSCTVQWDTANFGFIEANITYTNGLFYRLNRCVEKVNAPTALFTISSFEVEDELIGCINNAICFTNLSTPNGGNGELYYNWTFTNTSTNESVTSSAFQPCHTFTEGVDHLITLTVYNGCSCVGTYSKIINIKETHFELTCIGAVCEGASQKYQVSYPPECEPTYEIIGGDIIYNDESALLIHWNNPPDSGFGTIIVSTHCSPCTLTYSIPIIPLDGTIIGKDNLCVGEQYTYSLPQWASTDFEWSIINPDGIGVSLIPTFDRNEIVVQSYNPGTITLVANYTHSILQCSGTATFDIHISPAVTLTPSDIVCVNFAQDYFIVDEFGDEIYGDFPHFISGPDGFYQTGTTSPFEFSAATPGTYFVTPVGNSYCSNEPLQIVVDNGPDAPTAIQGVTSICPGIQYTYSVEPQQGAFVFWTVQGGTIQGDPTGNEITVLFTADAPTYSITAQYLEEYCESEPYSIDIDLIVPNAVFSPETPTTNLTTVCRSTIVTYSIATTDILDFIEWEVNPQFGSIVSGQNSTTVSISWNNIGGTTPIKVKVRRCNVEHEIQQDITINDFPDATMQFETPICTSNPTTFAIDSEQLESFTAITWDFGDSTSQVSTTNTIEHTYNDPISESVPYTVTAVVSFPNGCNIPLIVSQNITVSPSPVITLLPAADLFVNFNTTSTTGSYTVNIQSGVGSTTSIKWYKNGNYTGLDNHTITFTSGDLSAVGTYYAEVTNSFGCVSRTTSFRVFNGTGGDNDDTDPNCGLTYGGSIAASVSACSSVQVTYTPDGTPVSTQLNIDGTIYNTATATHLFDEPGQYPATAVSHYADGCSKTNTTTFTIPYIADLKYAVQCNGATSTLVVSDFSMYYPLTPIETFEFNINGGTWIAGTPSVVGNIQQAVFAGLTPGNYTVGIRIQGSGYATCQEFKVVQIFPAPDASFTMSQIEQVCAGVPITLTPTTIVPNYTYLWTFTDGGIEAYNSSPATFKTFQNQGLGIIRLTVTNPNGCSSTTLQNIEVLNSRVNAQLVQLTTPVCDGNPVTLGWTAWTFTTNPPPTQLHWFFQDANHPIGSGLTIEVDEPGYYFAYAENQYGCVNITQKIKPVFVEILPAQAPIFEIPATVCLGTTIEPLVFTTTSSYTWFVNGEEVLTESTPSFTFDAIEPGNYTIGLQVGYTTGTVTCLSPITEHEVSVVDAPNTPVLQITNIQCNPYFAQVTITNPQAGITYYWSNGQTGTTASSTHDGPLRVRAEINDCITTAQLNLPKDLNTLQWSMLTGCYLACEDEPTPQLLGPNLPSTISWKWIVNGESIESGQGNVTPLTLVPEPADYQLLLHHEYCDVLFGTANIGLTFCDNCDISFHFISMECVIVNGVRQITYYLEAYNNSGQAINTSWTTSVGMLIDPAIVFPNGPTQFTMILQVGEDVTQNSVEFNYIGYGGEQVCVGKIGLELTDDCDSPPVVGPMPLIKVLMMPNPTTDSVKINFEATEQAPVTIQIADGLGRVLFSDEHPTGTGSFVFDATNYAAGYYPIQIKQNGIVIYNNKIIKK